MYIASTDSTNNLMARLLRGEERYAPGKVYGFLYAPEGVKAPVRVRTADLVQAAKCMDISCCSPTCCGCPR